MENYQDQENQDLAPKGLIGAIQRESSGFNASKHVSAAVELNIHHSSTLVLKHSHLKITFPPENTKWLYNYLTNVAMIRHGTGTNVCILYL